MRKTFLKIGRVGIAHQPTHPAEETQHQETIMSRRKQSNPKPVKSKSYDNFNLLIFIEENQKIGPAKKSICWKMIGQFFLFYRSGWPRDILLTLRCDFYLDRLFLNLPQSKKRSSKNKKTKTKTNLHRENVGPVIPIGAFPFFIYFGSFGFIELFSTRQLRTCTRRWWCFPIKKWDRRSLTTTTTVFPPVYKWPNCWNGRKKVV